MNPSTNNGVIKLAVNVPQVIALAFPIGKPVTSQFGGDQIMFSTVCGNKLYVSPFVAEKIYAAGVSKGEFFSICKREVTHGNRRSIEFQIETPNTNQNETAAGSPSSNIPAAVDRVAAPTHPTSTKDAPAPAPNVTSTLEKQLVASLAARNVPTPPTLEGAAFANLERNLEVAGYMAIDSLLKVETYAQNKGLTDFTFGAENAQKLWVTLFLELSRKGARA